MQWVFYNKTISKIGQENRSSKLIEIGKLAKLLFKQREAAGSKSRRNA